MIRNAPILLVALGLLAVVLVNASFFTVDQRQRVLLFQLGQIKGVDFEPGLHFKVPITNTVRTFDGRVLTLDTEASRYLTEEKKAVIREKNNSHL